CTEEKSNDGSGRLSSQANALVASNGGADRPPDWALNLQQTQRAVVEIRTDKVAVTARAASQRRPPRPRPGFSDPARQRLLGSGAEEKSDPSVDRRRWCARALDARPH